MPTDPQIAVYGDPDRGATKVMHFALRDRFGDAAVTLRTTTGNMVEEVARQNLTAVFLVLEDDPVATTSDGTLARTEPCLTLRVLGRLLDAQQRLPVHIAIAPERFDLAIFPDPLTALDVLAFGISGVAGCWEASGRLLDSNNDAMGQPLFWSRTLRGDHRMVLFGQPLFALHKFYQLVANPAWPSTEEVDGRSFQLLGDMYPKYGFRIAAALGRLTADEMTIQTSAKRITAPLIAERLIALKDRTGVDNSQLVIQRALGPLFDGWTERLPNVDRGRPDMLPHWARQEGFPAHLPLIHGCRPRETADILFGGLRDLGFDSSWDDDRVPLVRRRLHTIVTVPNLETIRRNYS